MFIDNNFFAILSSTVFLMQFFYITFSLSVNLLNSNATDFNLLKNSNGSTFLSNRNIADEALLFSISS